MYIFRKYNYRICVNATPLLIRTPFWLNSNKTPLFWAKIWLEHTKFEKFQIQLPLETLKFLYLQLLYQSIWETLYVILYLPFFMKLSSLKILIRSSLFLSLTHGLNLLSKIFCNLKTSGWIFLISVWSHMMSENLRSIIYLRAVSVIVLPSTLLWVKKNLSPSLSRLNWSAEYCGTKNKSFNMVLLWIICGVRMINWEEH